MWGIHNANLTCATCLNTVVDQVQPLMAMIFPCSSGLFQQDNVPCHTAHIVQEWFKEHDKEFKVSPWPPNSPDINLILHLWDVGAQSMVAPPHNLQDLKDLLLPSWCQILQGTFRGLVESMPVLAAQGGSTAYLAGHNVLAHQCKNIYKMLKLGLDSPGIKAF